MTRSGFSQLEETQGLTFSWLRGRWRLVNSFGLVQLTFSSHVENVIGTAYDDILVGNALDNRLEGGPGDDTYLFKESLDLGTVRVFERVGEGNDTLDFTGFGSGITLDLSNPHLQPVSASLLLLSLEGSAVDGVEAEIENVRGSEYADFIVGNALSNTLVANRATTGVDTLAGGAGDDQYVLFAGQATLPENVTILEQPDEGVDLLDFSAAPAAVTANLAITAEQNLTIDNINKLRLSRGDTLENVLGSLYADTLTGNELDNVLQSGGVGTDVDNLTGAAGDDTYVLINGAGSVQITEAADEGNDTLDFSGFDTAVIIDLAMTSQTLASGGLQLTLGDPLEIENVIGSRHSDTIFGNDLDNMLRSGGATSINETLAGRGGDDRYVLVDSDAGAVTITEQVDQGSDTVDFSEFGVGVTANLGITTLQLLRAGGVTLTLTDASGIEDVVGSPHDDVLTGNALDNVFYGGTGADTLAGAAGADRNDEVDPVDTFDGGPGLDTPEIADDRNTQAVGADPVTFVTTGNWQPDATLGYSGRAIYHAPSTLDETAQWLFAGLESAWYEVLVTWPDGAVPAGMTASTTAAFELYDGMSTLGTVLVNQTVAPTGELYENTAWHSLGKVPIDSGSLKVKLPAAADGVVIADAVRIIRIEAAPIARRPIVDPIPPQTVAVGDTLIVQVNAHNAALPKRGLLYTIISQPGGMTSRDGGVPGDFEWNPSTAGFGPGVYSVTVEVKDEDSTNPLWPAPLRTLETFTVTVTDQNVAPTTTGTPPTYEMPAPSAGVPSQLEIPLAGEFSDADELEYSILNQSNPGHFVAHLADTSADAEPPNWQLIVEWPTLRRGEDVITVRATDSYGAYTDQDFIIQANFLAFPEIQVELFEGTAPSEDLVATNPVIRATVNLDGIDFKPFLAPFLDTAVAPFSFEADLNVEFVWTDASGAQLQSTSVWNISTPLLPSTSGASE